MDPETQRMIRDLQKKVDENNKLIKKVHKSIVSGRVFKLFYWIIILAVSILGYLAIKPIFESVYSTYQDVSNQVSETQESIAEVKGGIGSFFNFGAKSGE